jgi:trigger factor
MSSEFKDYIVDTIMKDKIYEIIKSQVSIVKEDKPLPTQEED